MAGRLVGGLLFLFAASAPGWAEEWPVRVLLNEGVPSIHLQVEGPSRFEELERRVVQVLPAGRELQVAWDGRAGASFRLQPDHGLFWINGRPYRGSVEVWSTPGGLQIINQVGLEDYVRGVMKVEANPDWPLEALKAQAVVARTFALFERYADPDALYHLQATTASQVYRGVSGEDPRSDLAVQLTRSEVLTYHGRIIPAFYHSASGGQTEDAVEVWEKKYPFIVGRADPFSAVAPDHDWEVTVPGEEIRQALERYGWRLGEIRRIETVRRTRSGRVSRIRIWDDAGVLDVDGKRLRQVLGPDRLRSTMFTVYAAGDQFLFVGKGWGHGVGLSQWGAKAMADLAYDYTQIVKYYFPLAELRRLPQQSSSFMVHGAPPNPQSEPREP
jgi:stage II sporulation protein D